MIDSFIEDSVKEEKKQMQRDNIKLSSGLHR